MAQWVNNIIFFTVIYFLCFYNLRKILEWDIHKSNKEQLGHIIFSSNSQCSHFQSMHIVYIISRIMHTVPLSSAVGSIVSVSSTSIFLIIMKYCCSYISFVSTWYSSQFWHLLEIGKIYSISMACQKKCYSVWAPNQCCFCWTVHLPDSLWSN